MAAATSSVMPLPRTVTVCGGSNSAHVTCAYLASKGIRVNLFTRQPSVWKSTISVTTAGSSWAHRGSFVGHIHRISSDPAEVFPEADVVLVCAPANAHGPLLQRAAPHCKKGVIVGTVYAQGGFDWAAAGAFAQRPGVVSFTFGLQNIPWICQKVVYGESARIIGPKQQLFVAASPVACAPAAASLCTQLFDIPTTVLPNFLCLTLTPSNQIIHPARYHSIFRDFDGKKVYKKEEISMGLYSEFDELSSEHLAALDNELQQIKFGLQRRYPSLDLSSILPIGERIVKQYGPDVADRSSLRQIFRTNLGYAGCVTPVVQVTGGVQPALQSRLFWEDIPFGLIILRELADHLGIPVPMTDYMIRWHQQFMGKEYLTPCGKLNTAGTGAPSALGIATLDAIVAPSLPQRSKL